MAVFPLIITCVLVSFSTAANYKNPIREHPHSVLVPEGSWANFSCSIKLGAGSTITWRIGDFTYNDILYNIGDKLPLVEGVTANRLFVTIETPLQTEIIGILATETMNGTPVQCQVVYPLDFSRNSFSKFALLNVKRNTTTEGTVAPLVGDPPRGLKAVLLNSTSFALTWKHPEMYFNDHYFNYSISAVVVSTGEIISQYMIRLSSTDTPWEEIDLSGRVEECLEINFTLSLVGDYRDLYTTAFLPMYPEEFSSEVVHVAVLFTADLNFQKVEIIFKPPQLCKFQNSRYILSYTNGNETWFNEPVIITDTSQLIKEEIVSGIEIDKEYTVTVTVITDFGNLSSSATFLKKGKTSAIRQARPSASTDYRVYTSAIIGQARPSASTDYPVYTSAIIGQARPSASTDYPVYIISGVLVATLVCAFIAGVTVLYCLRRRKKKKERLQVLSTPAKIHSLMVQNPLYEATEDHYEHLPDCGNGRPPPSLALQPATPTSLSNPGQLYRDITPQLPPPRKNGEAGPMGEKPALLGATDKSPKRPNNHPIPESQSLGGMSAHSGEDCYTIMSPAGTLTMLNQMDGTCNGLGSPACNDVT